MTQNRPSPEGAKRYPGGQAGNQNARTHGFYARAVSTEERQQFDDAANIEGLDEEIALLRSKIAAAAEKSENYLVLVPGISLLSRLLRTRSKIGGKSQDLARALENVWGGLMPAGMSTPEFFADYHRLKKIVSRMKPEIEGNKAGDEGRTGNSASA